MIVTDLIAMARDYIDEPSTDESDWTDAMLLNYVNFEHSHLFSKVRTYYEDWCAKKFVFPLVANQFDYWLPLDCVTVRRVELLEAAAVSGSSPFYTVNESTANARLMEERLLVGGIRPPRLTTTQSSYAETTYLLYDDQISFDPTVDISASYYVRLFYLQSAPKLHRAVAGGGGANTITFGTNGLATTLGTIVNLDNYYQHMRVEIESGNGAGEVKRITQYNATTKVATVDSNWSTQPNTASVYSIVSPIKEDYQELLALGAVFRAKGIKVEDDVSVPGTIYQAIMADMTNNLERRNHQAPRRVVPTQRNVL